MHSISSTPTSIFVTARASSAAAIFGTVDLCRIVLLIDRHLTLHRAERLYLWGTVGLHDRHIAKLKRDLRRRPLLGERARYALPR